MLRHRTGPPKAQTFLDRASPVCNSRYMAPRKQLLRQCLAYFLHYGVANLSLRPLAAASGTSARMLVHHFGSKTGLIAAVMEEVRSRLQSSFQKLTSSDRRDSEMLMLAFWHLVTSKANLPYTRLLLEVQVLAIQNPTRYEQYLADTSKTWLRLVERALPSGKNRLATATLCTAVIDGLLLELLSNGDLKRTSRALKLYIRQLIGPKVTTRSPLRKNRTGLSRS